VGLKISSRKGGASGDKKSLARRDVAQGTVCSQRRDGRILETGKTQGLNGRMHTGSKRLVSKEKIFHATALVRDKVEGWVNFGRGQRPAVRTLKKDSGGHEESLRKEKKSHSGLVSGAPGLGGVKGIGRGKYRHRRTAPLAKRI